MLRSQYIRVCRAITRSISRHPHYDLAATPASSSASAYNAELDLSIHSTTVKCEPDTTNKDTTKVNEPPRSPYLDYHHAPPFTCYNDNNNDLQAKMDTLQQYNQYTWNQYSDAYHQHSAAGIADMRYKVLVKSVKPG